MTMNSALIWLLAAGAAAWLASQFVVIRWVKRANGWPWRRDMILLIASTAVAHAGGIVEKATRSGSGWMSETAGWISLAGIAMVLVSYVSFAIAVIRFGEPPKRPITEPGPYLAETRKMLAVLCSGMAFAMPNVDADGVRGVALAACSLLAALAVLPALAILERRTDAADRSDSGSTR